MSVATQTQSSLNFYTFVWFFSYTFKTTTTSIVKTSDGLSLRLSPGSARVRYLKGLLKLGICWLEPSIGMSKVSGLRLG